MRVTMLLLPFIFIAWPFFLFHPVWWSEAAVGNGDIFPSSGVRDVTKNAGRRGSVCEHVFKEKSERI